METTKFDYTYIIRYRYSEENEFRQDFYSTNNPDLTPTSQELIDYFYLTTDDEADIEYQLANNFNSGCYLSDGLIFSLNKKELDKELTDTYIAYIKFVVENMPKDDLEQYKKEVIRNILEVMQRKNINTYAIEKILNYLGLDYDENIGIISQLNLILDADYRNNILLELTYPHKINQLRYQLEKMDKFYKVRSEKSQYRIGVLMLKFTDYTDLLYPKIKGKLSTTLRLLSEYYGIKEPTFRKSQLTGYKDPKTGENLYNTIINEHITFWDNLP